MTAKAIELEKESFIDMKNLGLLVNKLAADEKYLLVNWQNLAKPIQMQLPHKQKVFFLYFLLHLWNLN